MSLSEILAVHADAFRKKTGLTSKLSIADMTRLMDDLTWNQSNLLKGTSNQYRKLQMIAWGIKTTADTTSHDIDSFLNKTITYSATITNLGNVPVKLEIKITHGKLLVKNVTSSPILPGEKDKLATVTYHVHAIANADGINTSVITTNGKGTNSDFVEVKDERLYLGAEPGVWTPNPADKVGGVVKALLSALTPMKVGCAA